MRTQHRWTSAAVAVIALAGLSLSGPSAYADENETLNELAAVAPAEIAAQIIEDDTSRVTVSGVTATADEGQITISSDVGAFSLSAPEDTTDSSVTSVLLKDGGALFAIRIDNADAPRDYVFERDLPIGATTVELEEGGYFYYTAEGEYLGGVAAPWARDANGVDIPTSFSINTEGSLVQHVDLDSVENITYPVIADPLNGKWLVDSAWVTSQGNDYVVRALPTAYGRGVTGTLYLGQHTADLKAKLGWLANKVTGTIENQFHCHVVFNSFAGAGNVSYDMESWRPNVPYWIQGPVSQCNP